MGNWRNIEFSKIAKITKGISYVSSDYCNKDEGALFITLKCIAKEGGFSKRGIKYFKGFIPKQQLIKKGDLLFANTDLTRNGDIVGCPVYLPDLGDDFPITMSMDLSRVDFIDNDYDPEFIYYQLMTDEVRKFMKDHSSGSTVLHLNTSKVYDLLLLIPENKSEQTKIAEILSAADAAIEQTETLIAKYQRIKTGLMQDLLSRGIDEHGNIRSKATHKFVVKNGIEVPEEWEVKELGDKYYFDLSTGGTPSTERKEFWENGKIPWMSSGEVHKKKIYSTDNFITDLGLRNSNARFFPIDSVVIALAGQGKTRGTVAINKIELTSNQSIAAIIPNKKVVEPYFIYFYLEIEYENLRSISAGSGRAGLSLTILSKIKIPLPNKDEQMKIVKYLNSIESKIEKQNNQIIKLNSLKTGLMQDLLSGRMRTISNEQ